MPQVAPHPRDHAATTTRFLQRLDSRLSALERRGVGGQGGGPPVGASAEHLSGPWPLPASASTGDGVYYTVESGDPSGRIVTYRNNRSTGSPPGWQPIWSTGGEAGNLVDIREWANGAVIGNPASDWGQPFEDGLAELSGTGKYITGPDGIYYFNTPAQATAAALTNTGIVAGPGMVLAGADSLSQAMLNISGQAHKDLLLRGFTLDGRYGVGRAYDANNNIKFGGASTSVFAERCVFDDVRSIRNPWGGYGFLLQYMMNGAVMNCDIEPGGRNALTLSDSRGMLLAHNNIHMRRLAGDQVIYPETGPHSDADDFMVINGGEDILATDNIFGPGDMVQGRDLYIVGDGLASSVRHVMVVSNLFLDGYHANILVEAKNDGVVEDVMLGPNMFGRPGQASGYDSLPLGFPPTWSDVPLVNPTGDCIELQSIGGASGTAPSKIRRVTVKSSQFFFPKRHAIAIACTAADAQMEDITVEDNEAYTSYGEAETPSWVNPNSKFLECVDPVGPIKRLKVVGNKGRGFPGGGIELDGGASLLLSDATVDDNEMHDLGGVPEVVTANLTTDTFTVTSGAHDFVADQPLVFTASLYPGGISPGTIYYVMATGLTSTAFRVSLGPGELSPVDLTSVVGTSVAAYPIPEGVYLDRVTHQRVRRNTVKDRRATQFTRRAVTITNAHGELVEHDNDGFGTLDPDPVSVDFTPGDVTLLRRGSGAEINVRDEGAIGDGTTDDSAALAATLLRHQGETIVFPPGVYLLDEGLAITGAGDGTALVFKDGAVLKKADTFPSGPALTVNGDDVTIHASSTFIDGNRAGGAAGGGISWTAARGVIRGGGVAHTTDRGIIVSSAGASLICYGVSCDDNVDGAAGGHGFVATTQAVLELYDCEASQNDGDGVRLVGHASSATSRAGLGCHVDGRFNDNGGWGVTARSWKGSMGRVQVDGNYGGGVAFGTAQNFDVKEWNVQFIEAKNSGVSPTFGTNTAAVHNIALFNASNNQFGTVVSRTAKKNGLLIGRGSSLGSSGNTFSTVLTDQSATPGVGHGVEFEGGSANNRIGTVIAVDHAYAVTFGDPDNIISPFTNDNNLIGTLRAEGTVEGVVKVAAGSNNHVELVSLNDCAANTGEGLFDFYSTSPAVNNNRIGTVDEYNPTGALLFREGSSTTFADLNRILRVTGTGDPEGAVAAPPGCVYHRTASGTPTFYSKVSGLGNTGWKKIVGLPAPGTDGAPLLSDSSVTIESARWSTILELTGTGDPEGVVTAPRGSRFFRQSGSGATMYLKNILSGNTGWQAVAIEARPADVTPNNPTQANLALPSTGVSAGSNFIRLTPAADTAISGFTPSWDGRRVLLVNPTSFNITIEDESAGLSNAPNRVITGTGAAIVITGAGSVEMIYDGAVSRWRVIGTVA